MINILYFTASWCGPCKVLAPIMEQLGKDLPDVKIDKIDVDTDRSKVAEYTISSVPTLIFLKEGKVISKSIGIQSKAALTKQVRSLL